MTVLKIAVSLLLVYALLVGFMYVMQRKMLFLPGSTLVSPDAVGVPEMNTVALKTSDQLTLQSWYHPPTGDTQTIVYFQGNAATIAERAFKARTWIDRGYGVLLVGYRGFGGNAGSPSEAGLIKDGYAGLAFLADQGIAADRIVLYGESLGSGVATALAAGPEIRLAAVILEAPYTSVADLAARRYWFAPVRRLIRDPFDSLARIGSIQVPVLILHGRNDRIIPASHAEQLFAAANQPKRLEIIEQAGHSDLFDHGADLVLDRFLYDMSKAD